MLRQIKKTINKLVLIAIVAGYYYFLVEFVGGIK